MPPSYVPKKRGCSCFAGGCLGLVALVVLLCVGGGIYLSRAFGPFVADHPATLRTNDTSKEQYMAAVRKLQPLLNPDAPGQSTPAAPAPVSLSADDLNSFVAYDPHLAAQRGKCYFTIPADRLVVDLSAVIPPELVRSTTKYYFNARVGCEVDISGGAMRLTPRSIESLDGKPFPSWVMNSKYLSAQVDEMNKGLNESIHNNTDFSEAIGRIGSTKIGGGQITFLPAGKADGAPPPAAVATPANP